MPQPIFNLKYKIKPYGMFSETVSAITPDEQYIIAGCTDWRIINLNTGNISYAHEGHRGQVTALTISPDGNFVISGAFEIVNLKENKTVSFIYIWDFNTGKLIRSIPNKEDPINTLLVTSDGRYLISGSTDNCARVWELSSGKLIHSFEAIQIDFCQSFSLSPDERYLATMGSDHTLTIWDWRIGKQFNSLKIGYNADFVFFSPEGDNIITTTYEDMYIDFWDLNSGKLFHRMKEKAEIASMALSLKGDFIAYGIDNGQINILDLSTRRIFTTLDDYPKREHSHNLQVSSNNRYLVSSGFYGSILVWEIITEPVLEITEWERKGLKSGKKTRNPSEGFFSQKEKKGFLIFFSYATKDAELFQIPELAQELSKYDSIYDVLYWQVHSKDNFIKYMSDSIEMCDLMILYCSENARKSIPVEKEWTAADAMGKPIIPVYIRKNQIPGLLRSREGIRFDKDDFNITIKRMLGLINKKL